MNVSANGCTVYAGLFKKYLVMVSFAAELEKLIADENVLLIIEEQAEQE